MIFDSEAPLLLQSDGGWAWGLRGVEFSLNAKGLPGLYARVDGILYFLAETVLPSRALEWSRAWLDGFTAGQSHKIELE
jgi:hypothetical protein